MRLTNVMQMALPAGPAGRLRSYSVQVGSRGRRLPVSFDQARHVGAGDRPGSWLAISLRLPAPVDLDELAVAWHGVIARHGTLRSTFSRAEDGSVQLHEVEVTPGTWHEHEPGAGTSREQLRDLLDEACRSFASPSYRLCVLEPSDPDDVRPVLVLAGDHAHVDLWSLLVLARDLLAQLHGTPLPEPAEQDATRPPPFARHTAELAARPPAPDGVRRRWAEILEASGGVMPRFPLPLGDVSRPCAEVVEVRDLLDADQVDAVVAAGKAAGVRMLPVVVAAMTEATADLADRPLRAVFPVHSRYLEVWADSVGWFITNSVLEVADPDLAACGRAVAQAVELGSWPLADVLAAYGGMPEAPGMFAISWLDLGRLPVRIDPALEAQYVGASIRTDGVMVWFVLTDAGLHLRVRYPDTAEARTSVPRWLDAVGERLLAAAAR